MKHIAALFTAFACLAGAQTAHALAFASVKVPETAMFMNVPPGTVINFSGEQAQHLMKLLPASIEAGDPPRAKRLRGILIRNEKFDLFFTCNDFEILPDGQMNTITPECEIRLNRMNPDIYGIPFDELTPE